MLTYERPISANTPQDKKKPIKTPMQGNPLSEKLGFEMTAGNSAVKKRYPSTNPK